jgi:phage terminase small subunit
MARPSTGIPTIEDEGDAGLGPAMRALNPAQRRFVRAAITYPTGKDWQIAKAAGYSDKSYGALRVTAWRLFHDERILAALQEEAAKRLRASAVLGASVLAEIARTPGHPDQLKAATALLNRIGFHEKTEHVMKVTHTDMTGEAMMARIEALAVRLGVDGRALIGSAPKQIESEVTK